MSFINFPSKVWNSKITPLLSLRDLCRLDSATAGNQSLRPKLLEVLAGTEVEEEVIVYAELIKWIVSKGIKLRRIKLMEEISGLPHKFANFCSEQLVSLNTWTFQDDVLAMKRKVCKLRNKCSDSDDSESEDPTNFNTGYIKPPFLSAIVQNFKELRVVNLLYPSMEMMWEMILDIVVPSLANLDEINLIGREFGFLGDEGIYRYPTLSVTRTSITVDFKNSPLYEQVMCSVVKNFPLITSVSVLSCDQRGDDVLLNYLRRCPALQRVKLHVYIPTSRLTKLCRLCPSLIELQIKGYNYEYEEVLKALKPMSGLQMFYYNVPPDTGDGPKFFTRLMADDFYYGVVVTLPELHTLRVNLLSEMNPQGWSNVLKRSTKLRTVQCDRYDTAESAEALAVLRARGLCVQEMRGLD